MISNRHITLANLILWIRGGAGEITPAARNHFRRSTL